MKVKRDESREKKNVSFTKFYYSFYSLFILFHLYQTVLVILSLSLYYNFYQIINKFKVMIMEINQWYFTSLKIFNLYNFFKGVVSHHYVCPLILMPNAN